MTARESIFASIRRSLGVTGNEAIRRQAVANRISAHPASVIPARGQRPAQERIELFCAMVQAVAATVEVVPEPADVPAAVSAFLRAHNLPMAIRRGSDPRLESLPWAGERTLEVSVGPSDGQQQASVSFAFGAVAESGTLILTSGPDNPTTLNFLPDTHVVVVNAKDVAGDYETMWQRLREAHGPGRVPRTVNMVTGPSRSADIGQTLILGAHGPRRLHVIVVGDAR